MSDNKKSIEFFNQHIERYKKGVKILGWGSRKSQESRFRVLSQSVNFNNKSVLDVGCGAGDFYSYLIKKGFHNFRYKGIDITHGMISIAEKNNYKNAEFEVKDIINIALQEKYDFIVSSGIFNIRIDNNWNYFVVRIKKMFALAKIGIAFNLLSTYADQKYIKKDKEAYYHDPVKVLKFCMSLSRRVVLIHNYMPNDFTIYIYKENVRE